MSSGPELDENIDEKIAAQQSEIEKQVGKWAVERPLDTTFRN